MILVMGVMAAFAVNWVVTEVSYTSMEAAKLYRSEPAGTPEPLPIQQIRVIFPDQVVMVTPTAIPRGMETPGPCNDGGNVFYGEKCIWVVITPEPTVPVCSTPVIGEVCEWRYTQSLAPQTGQ